MVHTIGINSYSYSAFCAMDSLVNKTHFVKNIVKNICVKIFSWVPLTPPLTGSVHIEWNLPGIPHWLYKATVITEVSKEQP